MAVRRKYRLEHRSDCLLRRENSLFSGRKSEKNYADKNYAKRRPPSLAPSLYILEPHFLARLHRCLRSESNDRKFKIVSFSRNMLPSLCLLPRQETDPCNSCINLARASGATSVSKHEFPPEKSRTSFDDRSPATRLFRFFLFFSRTVSPPTRPLASSAPYSPIRYSPTERAQPPGNHSSGAYCPIELPCFSTRINLDDV